MTQKRKIFHDRAAISKVMNFFKCFVIIVMLHMDITLTTWIRKSWSNVGQNMVNTPTFDYSLFGEDLTMVFAKG